MMLFFRLLIIALGIGLGLVQSSHAFEPSFKRYLGGHDIIRVLHQKFPDKIDENLTNYIECRELDAGYDQGKTLSKRAALGMSSTVTGEPINPSPTPAFMKWYSKCLNTYISNSIDETTNAESARNRYTGEKNVALISITSSGHSYTYWKDFSPSMQIDLVQNIIKIFIGPGILENEDSVIKELISSSDGEQPVSNVLKKLIYKICMREEFLTY